MSVQGVNAAMQSLLSASAPLLRLQNDSSLQQTLQLGQVIEARVLRSFQGGRYLMELGGQERVIDSSIPLQEGQVLRARVLAMDEQVLLERIQVRSQTAAPEQGADFAAPAWLQRAGAEQALALFSQYASLLSPAQWQALQATARAQGASSTVLAAVTLARLGLPMQVELVQSLAQTLNGHSQLRGGQTVLGATSPGLHAPAPLAAARPGTDGPDTATDAQLLEQLLNEELAQAQAQLAQSQMAGGQLGDDCGGDSQSDASLMQAMLRMVLNARHDGALLQRVLSLPLTVDGRLTELRLALFDESEQTHIQPELRQRTVRIALDLDSLGRVELMARLVNRHVSLEWRAGSESMAALAGNHDAQLAQSFSETGFSLDSARYVVDKREEGAALQEVMARVIAGGSFSLVA